MRTKIGIYGGSFSPPHVGHLMLMEVILKNRIVDRILMVPCNTHAFNKNLIDPVHRLNMCTILCKDRENIEVSSYEIINNMNGSTYTFLEKISNDPIYKDVADIYYILGIDNALLFNEWKNYKKLLRNYKFIVVERQGMVPDPKVDWYLKPPHIYLRNPGTIPQISSTTIRNNFECLEDEDAEEFLNPEVMKYIQDNNLYGGDYGQAYP